MWVVGLSGCGGCLPGIGNGARVSLAEAEAVEQPNRTIRNSRVGHDQTRLRWMTGYLAENAPVAM